MTIKCNNCKRTTEQTDGWWRIIDHPTAGDYNLCHSCYRMKSLHAYRDTLLELIKEIQVSHSEPQIKMGMEVMRNRCEAIVRDTVLDA
jgi:hypothetical protein